MTAQQIDVHGLPALPEPHQPAIMATAKNTAAVRSGFETGGYEKSPDFYTAGQMRDYARAAVEAALRQSGEAVAVVMADGYPLWLRSWLESSDYRNLPAGTKLYVAPPATSGLAEALRTIAEMTPRQKDELIDAVGTARDALAAHDARGGT